MHHHKSNMLCRIGTVALFSSLCCLGFSLSDYLLKYSTWQVDRSRSSSGLSAISGIYFVR